MAPTNCALMKPSASVDCIPEILLVMVRPVVTVGFAKDVDKVNQ